MVFRRCRSPSERRAVGGLLARRGIPLAGRGVAGTDLFGLWDLMAPAGEALAGAAATGPLGDGGEVVLQGIAVAAGAGRRGLEGRLICEVADSCRGQGMARLVARPAGPAGPAVGLLRSAGFVAAGAGRAPDEVSGPQARVPAGGEGGWWELEL
jgi:ribosomal protein S18 acetylase RimI-like enzyme